MRANLEIPDSLGAAAIDAALEGLVGIASSELATGAYPALYDSGVRYVREPPGSERWSPPSVVLGRGYGDCEDLASWRAAELRVTGEDPRARARVVRSGPRTWHAIVERGDGSIEDPSRILGMGDDVIGSIYPVEARVDRIANGWIASITHGGRGVAGIGKYASDAIYGAIEASREGSVVGVIPTFGRVLEQAARAFLPPDPREAMRAIQQARQAAPQDSVPSGMDAESILRIASQIARIARGEASRKAREIERAVQAAKR